MTDRPAAAGEPSLAAVAFQGLCPRCGARTLFDGVARFAERCGSCGLDFTQFNVGDGPAAFLTLILGAILVAAAITLELTVQPPFWLHLILWIPLTMAATIASLRVCKAWLLGAEYRNNAREARIEPGRDWREQ